MQTEKTGVWNADLPGMKEKLEKMPFVKTAAVSRVLPNGIRVQICRAFRRRSCERRSGDMLVDAEGDDARSQRKEESRRCRS